jgi:hypothetical protein
VLRRLLMAIVVPPLLIAVAVLVVIGLRDFDLLITIISKLIVIAVIIGIPVMILKTVIFPRKKENGRR